MPSLEISIVMPAYNESSSIYANVVETVHTLTALDYDFEVVVVDDGSSDQTFLAALRAKAMFPERVRVVRYDYNEGKGNALTAGVIHSRGDRIVFLDADMDLHPEQLPTFFRIMDDRDVDAVIGSKWHPASHVDYPAHRRLLSLTYFALVRVLFGLPIRDTQTGIKVFRRRALERALPFTYSKGFSFDIELLAVMHLLGSRFADAPVTLSFKRVAGRLHLATVTKMLRDTLTIFCRLQRDRSLIQYVERNGRGKYSGLEQGLASLDQGGDAPAGYRAPAAIAPQWQKAG